MNDKDLKHQSEKYKLSLSESRAVLKYESLNKMGYILIANNEDAIEFFNIENNRKLVITINPVFKDSLLIFDDNESLSKKNRHMVYVYQVNSISDDVSTTITFQELMAIYEFLLDSNTVEKVGFECHLIPDYSKTDRPMLALKEIGWRLEKGRWNFYQFYRGDRTMNVSLLGDGFLTKTVPDYLEGENGFSLLEISYFSQFIQHEIFQWQREQAQKNFYKNMDENR